MNRCRSIPTGLAGTAPSSRSTVVCSSFLSSRSITGVRYTGMYNPVTLQSPHSIAGAKPEVPRVICCGSSRLEICFHHLSFLTSIQPPPENRGFSPFHLLQVTRQPIACWKEHKRTFWKTIGRMQKTRRISGSGYC